MKLHLNISEAGHKWRASKTTKNLETTEACITKILLNRTI